MKLWSTHNTYLSKDTLGAHARVGEKDTTGDALRTLDDVVDVQSGEFSLVAAGGAEALDFGTVTPRELEVWVDADCNLVVNGLAVPLRIPEAGVRAYFVWTGPVVSATVEDNGAAVHGSFTVWEK